MHTMHCTQEIKVNRPLPSRVIERGINVITVIVILVTTVLVWFTVYGFLVVKEVSVPEQKSLNKNKYTVLKEIPFTQDSMKCKRILYVEK